MGFDTTALLLQVLEIIWINILLSGDNAVVIALACKSLPERDRRLGVAFGAMAAVVLRLIFTFFVVEVLELPLARAIGGLLLLWIAVKLVVDERKAEKIRPGATVWAAVRTIALADAVMSLDNVVAIAAAARGSKVLIFVGLALSIPLIVFGSTLVLHALNRFPILVWAGAALLGWVAADMIAADPRIIALVAPRAGSFETWAAPVGAALVLASAGLLRWQRSRR